MSAPVPFAEIVAALQGRAREVAERYAPGGYIEGARYWALCPWRADRKIGSFHVGLTGPFAGRWREEATGEQGDMLDLIQSALNTGRAGALAEARSFLGLAERETEAQRELRKRQAAAMEAQRARDQEEAKRAAEITRAAARRIWSACHTRLAGTPVADYLAGRGIGFDRLGIYPTALRFHPSLEYRDGNERAHFPAMVAEIRGPWEGDRPGAFYGIHRTWLAQGPAGRWTKAAVSAPKKVLGRKQGGAIRLWPGRGPGLDPSRVYVTEGIEDGLSVAVLVPAARVLAAVDLGNLARIRLHPDVSHVTLVRDNDASAKAREMADRARCRWWAEGRAVSEWSNHTGGKDLNDALRAALASENEKELTHEPDSSR